MIQKVCLMCNEEFLVKPYRADTAIWCSTKCRYTYSDKRVECHVCGTEFVRKNWETRGYGRTKDNLYCSRECFESRSPKVSVNCSGCGKSFEIYQSRANYYSEYYCNNECRLKYGIIGRLTDATIPKNRYQKFIRSIRHTAKYYSWRKGCLERDSFSCQECGDDKGITVHHKMSMLQFVQKYGLNKDKIEKDKSFFDTNNGRTLCRACHFREHKSAKGKVDRSN